jgi:hypothetical protein
MELVYTNEKENQFFPIYKEIRSGAVAKSYMRKDFPRNEEMGKYFPIYKEVVSYIRLCNCSIMNFLIYGEVLIFFFISVGKKKPLYCCRWNSSNPRLPFSLHRDTICTSPSLFFVFLLSI